MFVPEFGLECDVLSCCCVSDGEVEITSPAFKKELEKQLEIPVERIDLVVDCDFGPAGLIATYAYSDEWSDPDRYFMCDVILSEGERNYFHVEPWM